MISKYKKIDYLSNKALVFGFCGQLVPKINNAYSFRFVSVSGRSGFGQIKSVFSGEVNIEVRC